MKPAWIAIGLLLCGCGTTTPADPAPAPAAPETEVARSPAVSVVEFIGPDMTAESVLARALEMHAGFEDTWFEIERRRVLAPAERADELHRIVVEELGIGGGVWLIQHPEGVTGGPPDGLQTIASLPSRRGLGDTAMILLATAGIDAIGVTVRDGPATIHVSTDDWRCAARLLLALPGATHASPRPARSGSALEVTVPPPPPRALGPDEGYENVAYHSSWDPLAGEAIWSTLIAAGISPLGIDNAGGSSVSVPASQAAKARECLAELTGVQLPDRTDPSRLGRIHIAEPDGMPRKPPNPSETDEAREVVAEFRLMDDTFGWQVATVLFAAGCDPLGRWEEQTGARTMARVDVPTAEAARARALVRVLASAWPPGTLTPLD